jgi:hypothetical protein
MSIDLVAVGYSVAATAVTGGLWLAWRFLGQRAELLFAFILALLFLVFQVITALLVSTVPRPWCWAPASIANLVLLLLAADVGRGRQQVWTAGFSSALVAGLVLQVWVWMSWFPHRNDPYDWPQYRIFLFYARASRLLATVELVCLAWPGTRRAILAGHRHLAGRVRLSGLGDIRL